MDMLSIRISKTKKQKIVLKPDFAILDGALKKVAGVFRGCCEPPYGAPKGQVLPKERFKGTETLFPQQK